MTDNLLKTQRNLIKSIAPKNQFVTVNLALGRDALDEEQSGKQLDIASTDLYYHMQNGMRLPNPEKPANSWFTAGPTQIALQADRSYAVKQQPYYVAETDGGQLEVRVITIQAFMVNGAKRHGNSFHVVQK